MITKIKIQSFAVKYWRDATIIILIILCYSQCSGNSELQLSAKQHEKNAEQYLSEVKAIKLDMAIKNKNYKDTIAKKDLLLSEKEKSLANISKKLIVKTVQIKQYNSTDIANYFKAHYNAPNDVKTTQNGTELTDNVSKKVITDVEVGESCKFENKELRNIAQINKDKFEIADKHIDSLNISINGMVKNYELANSEKDKANFDLNKALKKSNNKGSIYKNIAYGLGAVLIYEKTK
jgi:hypothetical protein